MQALLLDVVYTADLPVITFLLKLKMYLVRRRAMLARDGHRNRGNAVVGLDVRRGVASHYPLCLIEDLPCCGESRLGCLLSIGQRNGTGVKVCECLCVVLLFDGLIVATSNYGRLSYRFCEETDPECAGNSTADATENNNAADDTERDPKPAQRLLGWLWWCIRW